MFLLFAGDHYYPEGGWHDFRGAFDTVEAALVAAASPPEHGRYDWWHIAHGGKIVRTRPSRAYPDGVVA